MNIFERYGIKEVADVTFYAIKEDTNLNVKKGQPVLFLDTLKVSTIETTADQSDARGGKGNPTLITWDYNKEVNVQIEDAVFSTASLALIMGAAIREVDAENTTLIHINELVDIATDGSAVTSRPVWSDPATVDAFLIINGARYDALLAEDLGGKAKLTFGDENGTLTLDNVQEGRIFYRTEADGSKNNKAVEITIGSRTFGGVYRVVGDTLVRSAVTGKDEPFQFIIEKAKVNSEVTFTMQAEGDPTTFNMTLRVLRDEKTNMFKLIKYDFQEEIYEYDERDTVWVDSSI